MAFSPLQALGIGAGATGIGAGLGSLFGGNSNPANNAMGYLNQIPNAISPYYQPYINAGTSVLPQLQEQYGNLLANPGGKLNEIGANFQQSPGFQFALNQALQGGNHAAAAGGMAGSPQHELQNMDLATQLANQDYYNWLSGATGLYGQGLQGMGNMANMGMQASTNLSDQIAQALAAQSGLSYEGQIAQNKSFGGGLGNLLGGLGTLGAFLF